MRGIKIGILGVSVVICCLTTSCNKKTPDSETIAMIQIIDRNGVNETINTPERIAKLEKNDFLEPQPYEKVVRIYKKNEEGKSKSRVTTYHSNGEPWQYLETLGGRANGVYKEWHSNGQLRMESFVIEGAGDLSPEAHTTWVFDKESRVWREDGSLLAAIFYEKGLLEGDSLYYHSNGKLSKVIPYHADKIEGNVIYYNLDGEEIGKTPYVHGKKEGETFFKGSPFIPPREELYDKGRLVSGKYWNFTGELVSEVVDGCGMRPVYEEGVLKFEYEYKMGRQRGLIKVYRDSGELESEYHLIDGQKQGEEICYYEKRKEGDPLRPQLLLNWKDDEVHGAVRTWYPNGNLESEKEMSHNKKHGVLIAWYLDGTLMFVEEYDQDALVSGKYFRHGEDFPTSRVVSGTGIATIFDDEGHFLRKIEYKKGIISE